MKVHIFTLGCKVNIYETGAMEEQFIKHGYELTDDIADVYVVNTCSVTNIAERKSRQMLRRAKELNPKAIIVACGCYAQVAGKEIANIPEVDIIIGNNEKTQIVNIIEEYKKNKQEEIISDVMHQNNFLDFGITTYTEMNRAVIKVQDGCDRFCTYCIIPYARGKVRSRVPENILEEIKEISKKGIKEVVITGIHLASYGKDFKEEAVEKYRKNYGYDEKYTKFTPNDDLHSGGFRLIELLEQINKIDGIERIRLGSLEPKLINEEFINRLSKIAKICPHFHLSLQSGCDKTLKAMNRRYTTEEFEKSVELIRKYFKEVSLTTDIIVGFPGETDEDSDKTYQFLKQIKFYKMHIFKYSPKKGTVAEKMPNQIDGKIKEERSKKLIELSNKNEEEYNRNNIGKIVKVLFEEKVGEYYKGHTTNYITVNARYDENVIDKIKEVKIENTYKNLETLGKIID